MRDPGTYPSKVGVVHQSAIHGHEWNQAVFQLPAREAFVKFPLAAKCVKWTIQMHMKVQFLMEASGYSWWKTFDRKWFKRQLLNNLFSYIQKLEERAVRWPKKKNNFLQQSSRQTCEPRERMIINLKYYLMSLLRLLSTRVFTERIDSRDKEESTTE